MPGSWHSGHLASCGAPASSFTGSPSDAVKPAHRRAQILHSSWPHFSPKGQYKMFCSGRAGKSQQSIACYAAGLLLQHMVSSHISSTHYTCTSNVGKTKIVLTALLCDASSEISHIANAMCHEQHSTAIGWPPSTCKDMNFLNLSLQLGMNHNSRECTSADVANAGCPKQLADASTQACPASFASCAVRQRTTLRYRSPLQEICITQSRPHG